MRFGDAPDLDSDGEVRLNAEDQPSETRHTIHPSGRVTHHSTIDHETIASDKEAQALAKRLAEL